MARTIKVVLGMKRMLLLPALAGMLVMPAAAVDAFVR